MKLDSRDIKSIELYAKNHSRVASNRLVCAETMEIPVRYLDDSKSELYKKYLYSESISKSTFVKYLDPKIYKKVQRKTDVCDFCEWLRIQSQQLSSMCNEFDFTISENFNPREFIGKNKQ